MSKDHKPHHKPDMPLQAEEGRETVGFTIFEKSEFMQRVKACKKAMTKQGLDVLFITDPANMHYLTGYDAWSFYVPQCVLVAMDEEEPIWIGRGIDASGVPVTTYLEPQNIYSYLDNYVHADDCHPMDYIADVLIQKGYDNKVIGVELDSVYYTAACHKLLEHWLPNAKIRDCHFLVNWLRSVKSENEILLMRQAGVIMDKVMQVALDNIEPGVRQCDLVAKIRHAQIAGTEEFGGDYTAIVPLLPSGVHSGVPHLTWTDQEFQKGEITVMELASARSHYHCPMARTVFLGNTVPKSLSEIAKVAEEGIEAALDVVKEGVRCEKVEEAFRDTLAKYGFVKASRMGYSTGLNYPPDWGEHTMSLRPGAKHILKENMTFHMIPALWGEDWGVEVSQTFRVTKDGYEPFGTIPRKLFVKDC